MVDRLAVLANRLFEHIPTADMYHLRHLLLKELCEYLEVYDEIPDDGKTAEVRCIHGGVLAALHVYKQEYLLRIARRGKEEKR